MAFGGLRWLPGWGERDQGYANDYENSNADQFSPGNHPTQGLGAHHCGMGEAGPCGEGDQVAACRRIANGQKQENPKRDVKAEHHGHRRVLPHEQHHGISQRHKKQTHQRQDDLQSQLSIHVDPPEYSAPWSSPISSGSEPLSSVIESVIRRLSPEPKFSVLQLNGPPVVEKGQ